MTQLIYVQSGRSDDRVAFWERHPDHPNGEAMVGTKQKSVITEKGKASIRNGEIQLMDNIVQIAKTKKAEQAIHERNLVEVKAPMT